jgi:hypothetical protein
MRQHLSGDRGSIPAVLLTSIIVAGLVVVLVAAVLINQRTARFDRSYTTVLQEADEFAQQAAHHLIRGAWDPDRDDPVGQTYQIASATTCPAVADGDVCMTATKISPLRWEIEASAAARTQATEVVTRTVSLDVVDNPRFFLAAFADTSMQLRGSNAAASYGNGAWDTGNGIVGTNGDIRLNGNSTEVDGVHLHNWDNYPDLDRCEHPGGNDCDDVQAMPDAISPSARFGPRLDVGGTRLATDFIDETIAACETASGGTLPSYTSSTDGTVISASTFPECVENLTFDTDVTINPLSGPLEVYVRGQLSIANGVSVNCPLAVGCDVSNPLSDPDATRLQIFSQGGDVTIGNHTEIVAGIYAPRSDCSGNPSNAQGQIFGSMICDTIGNNGGWEFHYDDKLETVGSGVYVMDDYREE